MIRTLFNFNLIWLPLPSPNSIIEQHYFGTMFTIGDGWSEFVLKTQSVPPRKQEFFRGSEGNEVK